MRAMLLLLLISLLLSTQVLGGYYKKSYYDDYYKKKVTPAPTTPSPTTASPTTSSPTAPLDDEEKCGCYSIEKTLQEEIGDEICYSYTITRVCDDNYYQQKIDYIAFDADKDLGLEEECCDNEYGGYGYNNGGDCDIVTSSECKSVSQTYSNKVDGIKCKFDDDSYSGGGSTTKKKGNDDKKKNDDDKKSYNDDKKKNDDDDKSYNDDDKKKSDDKYYRRRLRTSYGNQRQRYIFLCLFYALSFVFYIHYVFIWKMHFF